MKNLVKLYFLLLLSFSFIYGVDTLELVGQIPGGAAFKAEIKEEKLYAGVGTSLWIYEISDPSNAYIIAKYPFKSLINEIIVENGKAFIAANHDGLWVLDVSSLPEIKKIAHYSVTGDSAAMDISFVPPDTIYLVDDFVVRILKLTDNDIVEIARFAENNVKGIDIRNNRIALCSQNGTKGYVYLYEKGISPLLLSTFSDSRIGSSLGVQDVYFSDRNDNILYVCGGTNNLGFSGHFLVLGIDDNDEFYEIWDYSRGGIPGIAPSMIIDMDSRNDTLFLVTTASLYQAKSDCPVLDGTELPDNLPTIGHIQPGLWFFDVAVHENLNALAIASEWYGIKWVDFSSLSSPDTIKTYPTGGWGQRPIVRGDTLWLAWEGYGVGIFDLSSPSDPVQIGRLPRGFAQDIAFSDNLCFVTKSTLNLDVYDLSPWYSEGEPEYITTYDAPGSNGSKYVVAFNTDVGPRVACQVDKNGFYIIDPSDNPDFVEKAHLLEGTDVTEFEASEDTLFISYDNKIIIMRISNDYAVNIAQTSIPGKAMGIGHEGDVVAVAADSEGVYLYRLNQDRLESLSHWKEYGKARDVAVKNNFVYVSLGIDGLAVLDITDPSTPEVIAEYPGSGGYRDSFGSTDISVDDDFVYLGDYHAGCFILKPPYKGIKEKNRNNLISFVKIEAQKIIINYCIPFSGEVKITVCDITGRSLYEDCKEQGKGEHSVVWNLKNGKGIKYRRGVYFCTVRFNDLRETKKVVIF